ncbi:hypothetical protein GF362_05510 [Candidatus Dojkabacteria bacterium]|nr:hypothetical protein [Candidatus Dojkabacteria bacterium]
MKKLFVILISILSIVSLFTPRLVRAQKESGISVSPSFFDLPLAEPGNNFELNIKITNYNDNKLSIDPKFYNVEYSEEPGQGIKLNDTPDAPPANWIKRKSTEEIILNSGEKVLVPFILQIPTDAKPGGYYPAIMFDFQPDQELENIGATSQIASRIYLYIKGEKEQDKISIEEFTPKNTISFAPRNQFTVAYRNSGATHIRPRGVIEIYDPEGIRQTNTLTLNDKFIYLLPNQFVKESTKWEDKTITNSLLPPLGKYKAIVKIYKTGDTKNPLVQDEIEFNVVPIPYIIYSILLTILFLLLLFIVLKKKMSKKQ